MAENKQSDLDKIKELVDLMIDKGLVELEIVDGANKILLKRSVPGGATITQIPMVPASHAAPLEAVGGSQASAQGSSAVQAGEQLLEINSPIVGTYYAGASPESAPFVGIGDRVDEDTVVCIIEAMKVMNEIKAETRGTIVEVLCKAGEAVEFGQALFKVSPD